jgi:hypothetical protein
MDLQQEPLMDRSDYYSMDELAGFLGFPIKSRFVEEVGIAVTEFGPARCVHLQDVAALCAHISKHCLQMKQIADPWALPASAHAPAGQANEATEGQIKAAWEKHSQRIHYQWPAGWGCHVPLQTPHLMAELAFNEAARELVRYAVQAAANGKAA